MQIRAEEQDDEDKQNIAMTGQKTVEEMTAFEKNTLQERISGKYDFPQKVGTTPEVIRNPQPTFKDDGTTGFKKSNEPVISLDPKCLTCSNF